MIRLILIAVIAILFTAESYAQTQDTTKKTNSPTTVTSPSPAPDIADILTANTDYTTAATAIKTADLGTALQATGPFTIFAPNNAAFTKLPAGSLDALMKDPAKLATLLKGHVVNGRYTKADIIKALMSGHGKTTLTTMDGQTLTLSVSPTKTLLLTNSAGNTAEVILYDLIGSNGVVNGINAVLLSNQ